METDIVIPIKCGHMIFMSDRVRIADNSKVIHLVTFILLISSTILGISYLFDSNASDNEVLFYMGVLIVITSGIAVIFMLTRSIKKEVYYADIRQIMLKQNYNGDYIANMKLKKGSIRYIALNNDQHDFDLFMDEINRYSLKTQFKK
jgi:uncharacterized membrane protein